MPAHAEPNQPGVITAASVRLEVTAISRNTARIRCSLPGAQVRPGYVAPHGPDEPDGPASWGEDHVLRSGALSLTLTSEPPCLRFSSQNGMELLRLPLTSGLQVERVFDEAAGDPDAAPRARHRLSLHFIWDGEQHFYGLGEGGKQFDRMDGARQLWNSHFVHGTGSDIGVPLVLSTAGYALFFDTAVDARLVVGRTEQHSEITFSAMLEGLDIYYLAGDSLRAVLGEVSTLLGAPTMPPRWSLGFLQSTRHFEDSDELLSLPATLREKRIPCDGLIFLSTYGDARGWNRGVGHLQFEPGLFEDPAATLAAMRAQHFQIITHEYPVVHQDSPLFAVAERSGYLLDEGYARIVPATRPSTNYHEGQRYIDFSNPAATAWWWTMHRPLADLGIAGWWLDGGEGPSSRASLHEGSGRELHNLYDRMRQQGFAEGEEIDYPGRRPFLLCRSGAAGMQRFGATCWSGDINNTFATLEAQVPLGLNTGMSGIPYWGTDIGGFFHPQPESAELYARWFQFGAFCPGFRAHGTVWREHVPWAFGPEIEAICRRYAELRYRLMPYTYTLAWQARTLGLPLMRPLVLNYPDDPEVWELGSQYLWGDDLLVAPVTRAGATSWPVYLPAGRWYDFWTHQAYDGAAGVSAPAPLDRLPLFVRAGAILPLAPVAQFDGEREWEEITLQVYPAGESRYELYEDDGKTRGYLDGHQAITVITCTAGDSRISLHIERASGDPSVLPARRRFTLRVLSPEPARVLVDSAIAERGDGTDPARVQYHRDGAHFTVIAMARPWGEVVIEL